MITYMTERDPLDYNCANLINKRFYLHGRPYVILLTVEEIFLILYRIFQKCSTLLLNQ